MRNWAAILSKFGSIISKESSVNPSMSKSKNSLLMTIIKRYKVHLRKPSEFNVTSMTLSLMSISSAGTCSKTCMS